MYSTHFKHKNATRDLCLSWRRIRLFFFRQCGTVFYLVLYGAVRCIHVVTPILSIDLWSQKVATLWVCPLPLSSFFLSSYIERSVLIITSGGAYMAKFWILHKKKKKKCKSQTGQPHSVAQNWHASFFFFHFINIISDLKATQDKLNERFLSRLDFHCHLSSHYENCSHDSCRVENSLSLKGEGRWSRIDIAQCFDKEICFSQLWRVLRRWFENVILCFNVFCIN